MSIYEIFASSIVLAFIIGALIGAVIANILWVEPLERQVASYRHRLIRTQIVAGAKREHLGTPYRPETRAAAVPTPMPLDVALGLIDNAHHSKRHDKHPDATVTPLRVETGRPV